MIEKYQKAPRLHNQNGTQKPNNPGNPTTNCGNSKRSNKMKKTFQKGEKHCRLFSSMNLITNQETTLKATHP